MVGTRTPPSQVLPLPARSGFALPPSAPFTSQGPLSEVNTTSVFSASFSSRSVSSTRPTLQSTSSTQSPNRPLADFPRNFSPAWIGVWTALCGRYRKNGRSLFAVMNPTASFVYRSTIRLCFSSVSSSATLSSRSSGTTRSPVSFDFFCMSFEYGMPR